MLTVVVPDDRPGMRRMLERELQWIDSEIIYDEWAPSLEKVDSSFILLLEHDSALERGSIKQMLKVFNDNPLYRQMGMVSPMVEFEDSSPLKFFYADGEGSKKGSPHLTRVGCASGAIIRTNSLKKYSDAMCQEVTKFSYDLSMAFWENGLRVMHEPNSLYYSPSLVMKEQWQTEPASPSLMELWTRECIV